MAREKKIRGIEPQNFPSDLSVHGKTIFYTPLAVWPFFKFFLVFEKEPQKKSRNQNCDFGRTFFFGGLLFLVTPLAVSALFGRLSKSTTPLAFSA